MQYRELRVRLIYKVTVAVLIVGLFAGSWATTSVLSRDVSHSYERAVAAASVEAATIAVSAEEDSAVSSPTPSSMRDFVAALQRAYAAKATWDSFGHVSIGTTRYLALESRIATLLISGANTQAQILNQTTENKVAMSIASSLQHLATGAAQQARKDFVRYRQLSLWAHIVFFLTLVLLTGGTGLVLYRREVDRRRLSEESERKVRALIEHGGDAILLVDADGVITFANEASHRLCRGGNGVIENTRFVDLARTLATSRLTEVLKAARHSPGELFIETMTIGEDELSIVEVNACDYTDRPAIGATIINIRDITERLLTQSALEREELFAKDLMEHAPLLICVTDLDLRLLRVNQSGARILGRSVEEMLGRSVSELTAADGLSILESGSRRALIEGEFTEAQTLVGTRQVE